MCHFAHAFLRLVDALLVPSPTAPEVGEWIAETFADSLEWEDLRTAFLRLQGLDQSLLADHYGGEISDADTARHLGMSAEAAKERRLRALERLAELLRVEEGLTNR
jgi:DNA-directed RNA polymerase specialized sigma24 family protein